MLAFRHVSDPATDDNGVHYHELCSVNVKTRYNFHPASMVSYRDVKHKA